MSFLSFLNSCAASFGTIRRIASWVLIVSADHGTCRPKHWVLWVESLSVEILVGAHPKHSGLECLQKIYIQYYYSHSSIHHWSAASINISSQIEKMIYGQAEVPLYAKSYVTLEQS